MACRFASPVTERIGTARHKIAGYFHLFISYFATKYNRHNEIRQINLRQLCKNRSRPGKAFWPTSPPGGALNFAKFAPSLRASEPQVSWLGGRFEGYLRAGTSD